MLVAGWAAMRILPTRFDAFTQNYGGHRSRTPPCGAASGGLFLDAMSYFENKAF